MVLSFAYARAFAVHFSGRPATLLSRRVVARLIADAERPRPELELPLHDVLDGLHHRERLSTPGALEGQIGRDEILRTSCSLVEDRATGRRRQPLRSGRPVLTGGGRPGHREPDGCNGDRNDRQLWLSSSTDPPPLCSMPFPDASAKYPPSQDFLQLQTSPDARTVCKPDSSLYADRAPKWRNSAAESPVGLRLGLSAERGEATRRSPLATESALC